MGEFGGTSHGDDYTSAPNSVKECARKNGFTPEPVSKSLSCNAERPTTNNLNWGMIVGDGAILAGGICLLAEPCGLIVGSTLGLGGAITILAQ